MLEYSSVRIELFARLPGKHGLAFARIEIAARLAILAWIDLPGYLPGYQTFALTSAEPVRKYAAVRTPEFPD